eukprot:540915-Amphidinium_carterae.1
MFGVRRLRSLAGRLAWAAGVFSRGRWAVNILHAVLASFRKDVSSGVEAQRQHRRKDDRDKSFLVATKRCSLALIWWHRLLTSSQLIT